jgi:hypothetical protein
MDKKSGIQVNSKQIVNQAIMQALGAAKKNAGNMSAMKIKLKFDNGKDKPKKSRPAGMYSNSFK